MKVSQTMRVGSDSSQMDESRILVKILLYMLLVTGVTLVALQ
jgi:hypothetical protein